MLNLEAQEIKKIQNRENVDRYLSRKTGAEKYFLENSPHQEIVTKPDGSKTKVYSEYWIVPPELTKEDNDKLRISLYVPGLFEMDQPNLGNHPLENKLISSLLIGNCDVVFVLKAEGVNSLAYESASGEAHGESLVATTAVEILARELKKIKQQLCKNNDEVEFEVLGYSEGSTQGASIATAIIEHGLGRVNSYTSLGGAGLVGAKSQAESNVVQFMLNAQQKIQRKNFDQEWNSAGTASQQVSKLWNEEGPDTFQLSRKLIGDAEQGGFEYSLGKAKVSGLGDIRNVSKWTAKYIASLLGLPANVPHERLQAITSVNHDYEKLVARGVPLVVLAGTEEVFFPAEEVKESVKKLRESGGKVLLLTSDIGHDFPHAHPSGVAYALELFKDKAGIL